ncbi:MAG: hypothetical protein ABH952_03830 [Candidatus Omnitrophota bacterium]
MKILWKEDFSKYTYYIKNTDLTSITKNINEKFEESLKYIEATILEDDKINNKQKIFIKEVNDDFEYYYIYEIRDNKITPLKYGDLTKRDGAEAIGQGIRVFIKWCVLIMLLNPGMLKKLWNNFRKAI